MLKKVRTKFILSAMSATLVVTMALIITINLINYAQVTRNLDKVMSDLASQAEVIQPGGPDDLPIDEEAESEFLDGRPEKLNAEEDGIPIRHKERRNTAQAQYSGRFFVINIDADENTTARGGSIEMTEDEATELAASILELDKEEGFYSGYRFLVSTAPDGSEKNIALLDITTEISAMRSLLATSLLVGLVGLLLTFLFIYHMSAKAIWPLKESMEKQKRFITDAGHELKTPLSVIGTNMDILDMDLPDNEWVKGTKKQVGKLRGLIEQLISLSRLEEAQTVLKPQTFNLSSDVQDTADAFEGVGEMNGTPLHAGIAENLTVTADEASVVQLITILTDNALKYALPDTEVELKLYKQGRHIYFETINSWDQATPVDQLDRFFDRFYRADKSRSGGSSKKGYGLGLSIAQAIAEKNHLGIKVFEDDRHRIVFRVTFS